MGRCLLLTKLLPSFTTSPHTINTPTSASSSLLFFLFHLSFLACRHLRLLFFSFLNTSFRPPRDLSSVRDRYRPVPVRDISVGFCSVGSCVLFAPVLCWLVLLAQHDDILITVLGNGLPVCIPRHISLSLILSHSYTSSFPVITSPRFTFFSLYTITQYYVHGYLFASIVPLLCQDFCLNSTDGNLKIVHRWSFMQPI